MTRQPKNKQSANTDAPLPPLAAVVARLGGLPAGANRTAAATDLLRRAARQLSGDASVAFYPMRDGVRRLVVLLPE